VSSTPPVWVIFTPAVFLYGLTRALPLPICGEIGSLCAAEIISHFGARPEVDLSQLLAESGRT
jgi:sugar/nucleoside kinase (ribokinase family)